MKPREVLALPVELLALSVLILRTILRWIFSIPTRILRAVDKLYYRTIQLRRSIVGEPSWKIIDYTHLGVHPPGGWSKISPEHRAQMEADNWVFFQGPDSDLAPWQAAPMPPGVRPPKIDPDDQEPTP